MKQGKQVILITGASAGMGQEFARQLLQDGHIVYGAARRLDKMEDIRQLGVRVLSMDVTDDASMMQGVETILKAEGRLDVLINNAGFGSYGAIEDVPMAEARYQLEVNVFGAARLMQLVLPSMRAQRYGRIINISSIGGKMAMPLGGWYHASKFALEALSDSLRSEVAPFGIDVVVIEPGGIKSEWGQIAMDNLLKLSGSTVYGPSAKKFAGGMAAIDNKVPGPAVIARLVKQAIDVRKPKTRYSGGFMAKPALLMKKILSDRMFDKMMMSQIKIILIMIMKDTCVAQVNNLLYSCYQQTTRGYEQFTPEHTLGYFISGETHIYSNGNTVIVKAPMIGLVRRNTLLKTVKVPPPGGEFKSMNIFFDQAFLRRYSVEQGIGPVEKYTGEPMRELHLDPFIKGYFDSLLPYFALRAPMDSIMSDIKTREALELLLRHDPTLKGFLFDFTEPYKIDLEAFMNQNYMYNVTSGQFAKLTGRSLAAFKRDFQKIFGQPPSQWLLKKRLTEAYYQIREKGSKPVDVYLNVGFENLSHFSYSFKKEFGVAPSML